jgi:hypothetical protein
VIQYSSGVSDKLTGHGVLDRPVKPDDDGWFWRSEARDRWPDFSLALHAFQLE